RRPVDGREEADVDLIVVVVRPNVQRRMLAGNGERFEVLSIYALLQTRIVLLNFVAEVFIGQEESEIRPEVEHRAPQESIYLEDAPIGQILPVICAENPGPHAPAVLRINEAEAIQSSLKNFVQRNLTG